MELDRILILFVIVVVILILTMMGMLIAGYYLQKDVCEDAGYDYAGNMKCLETQSDGRVIIYQLEIDDPLGFSWKINKYPSVEGSF